MPLARFQRGPGSLPEIGALAGDRVVPIPGHSRLLGLLEAADVDDQIRRALDANEGGIALADVTLLPPVDGQEVWGAGVTYERSKVAREEESIDGGTFYDLVYRADRPELFFKATASRVVGPGAAIRVRSDSKWTVPEPELAVFLDSRMRTVGFSIGNDVSARDIEGRNPLYLPQAKVYAGSCSIGPFVARPGELAAEKEIAIAMTIERDGAIAFEGATTTGRMARTISELADWLGRDNDFPDGAVLLTGTGVVPPDEFCLRGGDLVRIRIEGIGTLENPVLQGAPPP